MFFRKPRKSVLTTDNTKHVFKKLPNDYSLECVKQLIKIGFSLQICIHANGYQEHLQYKLQLFNEKRHIPTTNPTNDIKISPVEGRNLSVLRLMQNIHKLIDCG